MQTHPATRLLPAVLLLSTLLSGCSSGSGGHLAQTTLEFDFAGQGTDVSDTVSADLDSRPLEARYEADGDSHPDFYSAHDQLVQWAEETGTAIEVQHSQYGYFLARVDGVPADGNAYYWSMAVNGTTWLEGMSSVAMHDGTRITWTLTAIQDY
jgi:hypothetical protein